MTNLLYALTDHDPHRKRAHAMARRMRVGPLGVRRRITHPPIRQPGIPEGGGRVPMAVERLNPRRTVRP